MPARKKEKNMNLLTKEEKRTARRLGVTAADVRRGAATCYGTNYSLLNEYYYIHAIYNGYSQAEIYRDLLRRLIRTAGDSYLQPIL